MEEEQTPETNQLVWRNRELLLKIRVLQSELESRSAEKQSTMKAKQIIKSTSSCSQALKLETQQQQSLAEKQNLLTNLNTKISCFRSQLFRRTKDMIAELRDIYPILEHPDGKGYSICDIKLPTVDHLEGHDETMVSVAIGYVTHIVLILSELLDISLRFPLRYYGSKSFVVCNRRNQLFPLFVDSFKSRDFINFSQGVHLLNLNIVQIRTLHGLSTKELDQTLANLYSFSLAVEGDLY